MNTSLQTFWIYKENLPLEYCYQLIKNAGFDGVDLSLDASWSDVEIRKGIKSPCVFAKGLDAALKAYEKELEIIKKNGLKICQAHAPFPGYVSGFPEIESYAHEVLLNCIKFCDKVGIPLLVVHGVTQLYDDKNESFEKNREVNLRLYRSLIPEIKKANVKICLENLFGRYQKQITQGFCANPYEAVDYLDTLNKEAGKESFVFCLDTGHLNLIGANPVNFIKVLGNRIKALHIQDNWGLDDNHLMPYAGSIRWEEVLEALKEVYYEGTMNFEVHKQLSAPLMPAPVREILIEAIGKMARYFAERVS